MGYCRSLLVPGILGGALSLGAAGGEVPRLETGPLPPLHPTAIMGSYRDHPCIVVGVSGNCAVVESQGAEVRLPSSATFDPARAKAFLPGSIEIRGQTAAARQVTSSVTVREAGTTSKYDGGVASAGGAYEATIVASQAYRGCFLVLLFFDPDFVAGVQDSPSVSLTFQNIGDVPAGVETGIKTEFGYIDPGRRNVSFLPLLFSRGAEIRTNLADETARLFRRMEMLRHKALVESYLAKNSRGTMPARPYMRFPPIFPPQVDRAAIPARLKVDFMVTPDGTVEEVVLPKALAPDVQVAVERAVGGWLFLPKLAVGQPVGIALSMELTFAD